MIYINNLEHDDFNLFRSLKENLLIQSDKMIVESKKVVSKLLETEIGIHKILISNNFLEKNPDFLTNPKIPQDKVFVIPDDISENIKGHNWHNGVMALTDRPKNLPLESLKPPYLILNGLTSPEKVGTIVRTACAFGIKSLLIDKKTISPYSRRCIRVSMGNIFEMNVRNSISLTEDIQALKINNTKMLVTANSQEAVDLQSYKFNLNSAVIIGSEGHGVEEKIRELADSIIRIPISDYVAHLNASCATSIILYKLNSDLTFKPE